MHGMQAIPQLPLNDACLSLDLVSLLSLGPRRTVRFLVGTLDCAIYDSLILTPKSAVLWKLGHLPFYVTASDL